MIPGAAAPKALRNVDRRHVAGDRVRRRRAVRPIAVQSQRHPRLPRSPRPDRHGAAGMVHPAARLVAGHGRSRAPPARCPRKEHDPLGRGLGVSPVGAADRRQRSSVRPPTTRLGNASTWASGTCKASPTRARRLPQAGDDSGRLESGRIWVWLAGYGETLRPPYKAKFYVDGKLQWTSGNSRYSMMSST